MYRRLSSRVGRGVPFRLRRSFHHYSIIIIYTLSVINSCHHYLSPTIIIYVTVSLVILQLRSAYASCVNSLYVDFRYRSWCCLYWILRPVNIVQFKLIDAFVSSTTVTLCISFYRADVLSADSYFFHQAEFRPLLNQLHLLYRLRKKNKNKPYK